MKTTHLFVTCLAAVAVGCSNPSDRVKPESERMALEAVQSAELPQLTFANESHDFGTISEGDVVETEFKFTNTGKAPVVISNVQPSCGCTTPEWTREPIMPGKTGKVTASYNSAGRPGSFNKTITVVNNGEVSQIVLTIQGSVEPKK